MSTTSPSTTTLDRAAFLIYTAGLGLIQFNVRAEILLGIAALLWLILAVRDRRRPDVPPFFLPLLVLAGITLVGSVLSTDPLYSLARDKQLLLYLLVPITMRVAAGPRASKVVDVIIAVGALSALIGILQWAMLGYDASNRPRGTLSHWMTYSGLLMLVVCAAAARLVYAKRDWIWPAVAVPALMVALVFSFTRNAWIGALAGLAAIFSVKDRRYLVLLPALALVVVFFGPLSVRARIASTWDPHFPGNQDRIAMLKAGVAIVKDHPLFGVGANMIPRVYLQYRTPDAVDSEGATQPETRSHLHNVPMQLAAERGLFALAAWIWFVAAAGIGLVRLAREGRHPSLAATGLAALVAMVAAGLFEHNFGDSEFLILLLAFLTLPYAAERRLDA